MKLRLENKGFIFPLTAALSYVTIKIGESCPKRLGQCNDLLTRCDLTDLEKVRVLLNDVRAEIFTDVVLEPFLVIVKNLGQINKADHIIMTAALVANAHGTTDQAIVFLKAIGM